jgi:putative ABC transport system permease protein
VGAKGSPIQLILSSVYHLDVPTGNIPLPDAQAIMQNPAVRKTIPLAMGDSVHGLRIVGTTPDYPAHYGARLAQGRLWSKPMEAVLGASAAQRLGLGLGATFIGAHGIAKAGELHKGFPYTVVGVLAPTGTVLDRLVLTPVESVWVVHEHHHEHHEEGGAHANETSAHEPRHADEHAEEEEHRGRELTALLIQYRSPLAAATLPRFINSQSALQAAAPAFETARLLTLLGVGFDTLRAFGGLLIFTAGLGVFIALYNALRERRYDLAIMRTLGASRGKLLAHILLEGLLLVLAGTVIGIVLGHAVAQVLGVWLKQNQQLELSGWTWVTNELWLFALAVGVGLAAALLPAFQAYRTDIARTLASR